MGKKHNQDTTAAENVLALYSFLLTHHQHYSLTQLSEKFSVSKPTMLRYLQYLEKSEFGKIHCEKKGREHFYSIHRPSTRPKISLSPAGLQQLSLCRNFISYILPTSMQKSADITLQQASAYLPDDAQQALNTLSISTMDIGESFSKGKINYTPFEPTLKTLIQAIYEQSVCTVCYQKRLNVQPETFDYAPQRLILYNDTIYIRGFKVTDKGKVNPLFERGTDLALHRFRDVILTKRNSKELPPAPEISKGAFGYMDIAPFIIELKFTENLSTYISERIWSTDQNIKHNKNGTIILTITARSKFEIIPWILGFGAEVEVLSPQWLKEKIQEEILKMNTLYTKKCVINKKNTNLS